MLDEKLIEFKRKLENRTEQEREEQKKQLQEHFARLEQEYNKHWEEKKIDLFKIGVHKAIKLYEKYDVDYYGTIKDALLSGITIDKLIELFNIYEDDKIKSMFDLEEFIEFMINYHYLKYNIGIYLG